MQNYNQAIAAFTENLQTADVNLDYRAHNLYAGLIALTSSIQADMAAIHRRLDQIERDLRQPR